MPDRNNKIRFNTVALPWLANSITLYRAADIEVTDNPICGTVSFGSGEITRITAENNFPDLPIAIDGAAQSAVALGAAPGTVRRKTRPERALK